MTFKSTQAIVTTYDLPYEAAPHDTLLDKAGNVWFSDFQHHVISKLDPKTGKVTRYPVPISKPGFPTGGLMITMDKDGNVWEAMMGQAQFAKLDPKTGKVSVYLAPDWKKADTRSTMIDALHSDVDGKLWAKTSGGPDPGHANKLYQFDLATEKFHEVLPPAGKRDIAAYGLITDLDNNVYGLDNNPDQRQIWRTNAKTGRRLTSIFRSAWAAPGEDISTRRIACGSRNSMPMVTRCMTPRAATSRSGKCRSLMRAPTTFSTTRPNMRGAPI